MEELMALGMVFNVSHFLRNFVSNRFSKKTRKHFNLCDAHFSNCIFLYNIKSKNIVNFSSFYLILQPAIATDMPDVVVSIWSCTSYPVVFRVEFVWIVDTIRLDDIAITAKRDSTEIQPSQSPTKKHADVSSRSWFFAFVLLLSRAFNDFSTNFRFKSFRLRVELATNRNLFALKTQINRQTIEASDKDKYKPTEILISKQNTTQA
jgi:DNA-binding XRE family transcriptional regulator